VVTVWSITEAHNLTSASFDAHQRGCRKLSIVHAFIRPNMTSRRRHAATSIVPHDLPPAKMVVPIVDSAADTGHAGLPPKNPHAAALGRLGGLKGGRARANSLSAARRRAIARKAALARWHRLKP